MCNYCWGAATGAIVLGGVVAVEAPEWIRSFNGSRIIVQNEAQDLVWAEAGAGSEGQR